jgi:hypothetical protein
VATGDDWSEAENEATVASYLSMLKSELEGKPYNKKAENARLRERLNGRPPGAVEFKHANISAVLLENGLVYIEGYKPRRNVQQALRVEVERQLGLARIELDNLIEKLVETPTDPATAGTGYLKEVDPPAEGLGPSPKWMPRKAGFKRNYAERDAKNRKLGLAGELAVIAHERSRLLSLGFEHLAKRVKHVSVSDGDGLGYDIQSFDDDGVKRLIEVKTTKLVRETPFLVSSNEVAASDHYGEQFQLYRLFRFGSKYQGMYRLFGSLSNSCELKAQTFLGAPRGSEEF